MKLVIANDHAAVEMKKEIREYLESLGHEVVDIGSNDPACRDDYPVFGQKAGEMVASGEVEGGVLICGTGAGICLAANKVKGVRAVSCSEPVTAALVKSHNHANIIGFGARIIGLETAKAILDAWLNTECTGGRHQERVDMIDRI